VRASDGFLERPALDGGVDLAALGLEADTDLAVPERIGSLAVEGILGAGATSIVFVAWQEDPGRRVAVKVLRDHVARASRRRFESEVRVLARLDHPAIAKLFEAHTSDRLGSSPYFVMELVEGWTLDQFARRRALDVEAKVLLLARICDALEHAHRSGVIHRDLKPRNILVGPDGAPKVLDFGIACLIDGGTSSVDGLTAGQILGTLDYMSPEQAEPGGEPLDARSDVYSLGVLGYELLSGELPHDVAGRTLPEAVRALCGVEPMPLGRRSKALRGELQAIFAKALEKDRERRHRSAAALAEDLRRVLRNKRTLPAKGLW